MNKLICRICMEEGVMTAIFAKNDKPSLCDMIEYCSNIKIEQNDGLPEQLCSNCAYKLGIAYNFKQTCERSDVKLRWCLGLERSRRAKVKDATTITDPIVMTKTTTKKCKCMQRKKRRNYTKIPESEKKKTGPKAKPKKINECTECHKQFPCKAQLEMHIWTHTGEKPFSCMHCDKSFTQKHNLTIHLRMHTGEKPFKCEICSKTFAAQGNLRAHIKCHTGQKDHICAECNKGFITSSELTRHMSLHTGIKKFKCDICNKGFNHKKDMKQHKINKHDWVPSDTEEQANGLNRNNDSLDVDEVKNKPSTSVKGPSDYIPLHFVKSEEQTPNKSEKQILIKHEEQIFIKSEEQFNQKMEYDEDRVKDIFTHSIFG